MSNKKFLIAILNCYECAFNDYANASESAEIRECAHPIHVLTKDILFSLSDNCRNDVPERREKVLNMLKNDKISITERESSNENFNKGVEGLRKFIEDNRADFQKILAPEKDDNDLKNKPKPS